MSNPKSTDNYYGKLLENQLMGTIQKKLDTTSSFKKNLAGIQTIQDAQQKGYAPTSEQIEQMKLCINKHADVRYARESFRNLPTEQAIKELLHDVLMDISELNRQWQKQKKFSFDAQSLKDLSAEASALMVQEHDTVKKKIS